MNTADLPIRKRTCMSRVCARERIVWAKLSGYKHWPARIIPDKLRASSLDYQQADSYKKQTDDTLVVFFGTNDLAWVNAKRAVVPWKKGKLLRYHVTEKKHASKKNTKEFADAVHEVRSFCSETSGMQLSEAE